MKKRKLRNGRKPRSEWTYARTAGEVEEISLHIDPENGDVVFDTPVVNTYIEASYEREKGPKVLSRTPLSGPGLQLDLNDALMRNYDAFIAIDTNTRPILGQRVSVTGIILGVQARSPASGNKAIAFRTPFCLEFVDVTDDAERIGWVMAIHELRNDGLLPESARVGVIVDSHLNALSNINSRKEPICPGLFLPSGFQLIYASADVGREYGANKLIQMADQVAHQILDHLAAGLAPLNQRVIHGAPFKAYRRITGRE